MCSGKPGNCRAASGHRIKASPPIARAASECACLVRSAQFWLASFATGSARAFHKMGRQYHDNGSPYCRVDVCGHGRKTYQAGKGEDVRRVRPAERPLRFRLRSIELVHDEYLRERPIDAGTVLALLPAERSPSHRIAEEGLALNARSGRSL